jgi:DNA-binding CsgD family transcriptional regulator/tetratricopeptide (TPR) repeat protein
LRRALAEPTSPQTEADVLLQLGLAEFSARQPDWRRHLHEAVEAAAEDRTRIAAAVLLAQTLRLDQRAAEALEVCDSVAGRLEKPDDGAHWRLEATAVASGIIDASTAPSVADRARGLVVAATKHPVPPHALAIAAFLGALMNHPADYVAELARQATAAGSSWRREQDEPPWLRSWSLSVPGLPSTTMALSWAGRFDEAQTLLDGAEAEARAQANTFILPVLLGQRAWLALRRGDLTAAEADARELLGGSVLSGSLLFRLLATGVLVAALVERGSLTDAERQLESAAADLQSTLWTAPIVHHARGRLRFARRRFAEALENFEIAGDLATRALALSPAFLPWRSDAALAHLMLGHPDAARRVSQEELEAARAFGAPQPLGVALRAAGLVEGGLGGEGLLREAVDALDGPDNRLQQAHALADLGAHLRRSNRRVEARDPLRQAVDIAHRVGAQPLASRAETELRATGAKPRRVLLTGLEALTASERRIAELAAHGHSNSEIAQTLFVTARTVEGHLTHVFQKLGVNARTDLPRALAAHTVPA